jgi:hypothetical protein
MPIRERLLESDDGQMTPRPPAQAPRVVSHGWPVSLAVAGLGCVVSAGIVGAIVLVQLGSRALSRVLALLRALGLGSGLPLS